MSTSTAPSPFDMQASSLHTASCVMEEEDDDPVVEEIDVYLAKSLAENLYLFQYPLRPASASRDRPDTAHVSARIKPGQQKVELETAVDATTSLGGERNGLDRRTLRSVRAAADTSRYAAAVFRAGELHVTPLRGILQLRPDFSYLDRADDDARDPSSRDDEEEEAEEEEAKAVSVRFLRPESEWTKQRRLRSYEHLQKRQEEEPWAPAQYHGVGDRRAAERERQYLFCQAMEVDDNADAADMTTKTVQTPQEYLDVLMPSRAKKDK